MDHHCEAFIFVWLSYKNVSAIMSQVKNTRAIYHTKY